MKKNLLGISLITISCLYVLLSAIIILVTIVVGYPPIYGIGISIIVLLLQFLISPFITDLSMKWFYKAKFDHEMPEYLNNFIKEVCTNNNMKYPKIGYIDDGAPNAFTYGHTKNDARIVITRGILELLDEEEVKSVVGHELGHAVHYDMLVMTVAQLVPLVLYFVYEMFTSSDNDDNNSGKAAAIGYLAYILYVISNYIILWLSRTREYYADSFSIEATKNPNSLASALVKIGYGLTTANTNKKHSTAKSNALGIFDAKTSKSLVVTSYDNGTISKDHIKNAMKWEQWNIWAIWYEFNSTHPLISKRLLAISSRSKEYNQEPFITFDLEKPESFVDDFLIEVLINSLPGFIFFIGLIVFIILLLIVPVDQKIQLLIIPVTIILMLLASYLKFVRRHPNKDYNDRTIRDLLGEVKVSNITAIPCTLQGEVIGRGDPGYIFNEDMTLKDQTGIIFLDYNQPLFIINKIYGLFKNNQNVGKQIKVTGWYRRSPVPYVEIKTYEVDGQVKTIFTYPLSKALYIIGFIINIVLIILLMK